MSITLFKKTDFRGDSFVVAGNKAVLDDSPVGHSTSSLRMSDANDVALFFHDNVWKGEAMFRKGKQDIHNVGLPPKGKVGMGNDIRSVRLTPFTLPVTVHVIQKTNGELPGNAPDIPFMEDYVHQTVQKASSIWEPFLLHLGQPSIDFVKSDELFDVLEIGLLTRRSVVTLEGVANVFLVNSLGVRQRVVGKALPRCLGDPIAIEIEKGGELADGTVVSDTDLAGLVLAHELGHYLGLDHKHFDDANLMTRELNLQGSPTLDNDQVEAAHRHLARDAYTPKGVRRD